MTNNNIIIANSGSVVNVYNTNNTLVKQDTKLKWQEKKTHAFIVAEKLKQAKKYKRSERMRMCGQYIVAQECLSCGHMHIKAAKLCRDRLCPICTWRLSMRRFASMYTIVEGLRWAYPESSWYFCTLTCQNCRPTELKQTLDEMLRAWNGITSTKKFKFIYDGWARSLEITYNKETKTVHPHFHVLLMSMAHGELDYIIKRWMKTCEIHTSWSAQDIKQIKSLENSSPEDEMPVDSILETYKYSIKSSDIEDMPLSVFKATDEAIQGRRLVAFGGKIKEYARLCEIKQLDEATAEDEAEAAAQIKKCVHCGSKAVAEVVGEWSGSGYIWRSEE